MKRTDGAGIRTPDLLIPAESLVSTLAPISDFLASKFAFKWVNLYRYAEMMEEKHELARAQMLIKRMLNRTLVRSFVAWVDNAAEQKRMRHSLQKLVMRCNATRSTCLLPRSSSTADSQSIHGAASCKRCHRITSF